MLSASELLRSIESAFSYSTAREYPRGEAQLQEVLERACDTLWLGSEYFVRQANVGAYVNVLSGILRSSVSRDNANILMCAMRVMAFVAEAMPNGSRMMVRSCPYVVDTLLHYLNDFDLMLEHTPLLEDLLRCLHYVALEAHETFVMHRVVEVLLNLDMVVAEVCVRTSIFSVIANVFALGRGWEWEVLAPSVSTVIDVLKREISVLTSREAFIGEATRLMTEKHIIHLFRSVCFICDRLLITPGAVEASEAVVNRIIECTVALFHLAHGANGDVASKTPLTYCTPIVSLFHTHPFFTVNSMLTHGVLEVICSAGIGLMGTLNTIHSSQTLWAGNQISPAINSALVSSDVMDSASEEGLDASLMDTTGTAPLVVNELGIIPLLEFLLVVIPPSTKRYSHDDFLNITSPYITWARGNDFHHFTNCEDTLSYHAEAVYQWQRRRGSWSTREILRFGQRVVQADMLNQTFISDPGAFPRAFQRLPFISGFVHGRMNGLPDGGCRCKAVTIHSRERQTGMQDLSSSFEDDASLPPNVPNPLLPSEGQAQSSSTRTTNVIPSHDTGLNRVPSPRESTQRQSHPTTQASRMDTVGRPAAPSSGGSKQVPQLPSESRPLTRRLPPVRALRKILDAGRGCFCLPFLSRCRPCESRPDPSDNLAAQSFSQPQLQSFRRCNQADAAGTQANLCVTNIDRLSSCIAPLGEASISRCPRLASPSSCSRESVGSEGYAYPSSVSLKTRNTTIKHHSPMTGRAAFMSEKALGVLLTECVPALLLIIKATVNPLVVRHSVLLLLRCLSLAAEFCAMKGAPSVVRAPWRSTGPLCPRDQDNEVFTPSHYTTSVKSVQEMVQDFAIPLATTLSNLFLASTTEYQTIAIIHTPFSLKQWSAKVDAIQDVYGISPNFRCLQFTTKGEILVGVMDTILLLGYFEALEGAHTFTTGRDGQRCAVFNPSKGFFAPTDMRAVCDATTDMLKWVHKGAPGMAEVAVKHPIRNVNYRVLPAEQCLYHRDASSVLKLYRRALGHVLALARVDANADQWVPNSSMRLCKGALGLLKGTLSGDASCINHVHNESMIRIYKDSLEKADLALVDAALAMGSRDAAAGVGRSAVGAVVASRMCAPLKVPLNVRTITQIDIDFCNALGRQMESLPSGVKVRALRPAVALYDYIQLTQSDLGSLMRGALHTLNKLAERVLQWAVARLEMKENAGVLPLGHSVLQGKYPLGEVEDLNEVLEDETKTKLAKLMGLLARVIGEKIGVSTLYPDSHLTVQQPWAFKDRVPRNVFVSNLTEIMWMPVSIRFCRYVNDGSTRYKHYHKHAPLTYKAGNTIVLGGKRFEYYPIDLQVAEFSVISSYCVYSLMQLVARSVEVTEVLAGYTHPMTRKTHYALRRTHSLMGSSNTLDDVRNDYDYLPSPSISTGFSDLAEEVDDGDDILDEGRTGGSASMGGLDRIVDTNGFLWSRSAVTKPGRKPSLQKRPELGEMERPGRDVMEFYNSRAAFTASHVVLLVDGYPLFSELTTLMDALTCFAASAETLRQYFKGSGGVDAAAIKTFRDLPFWSTEHTIQYVLLKHPLPGEIRSIYNLPCGCVHLRDTRGGIQTYYCSVMHLSTAAEEDTTTDVSALRLLHALAVVLQDEHELVSSLPEQRRLSSALVHEISSQHMPLLLPSSISFNSEMKSTTWGTSHLASYALWNYPLLFPFTVRRKLVNVFLSWRCTISQKVLQHLLSQLQGLRISERSHQRVPMVGYSWAAGRVAPNMRCIMVSLNRNRVLEEARGVFRMYARCPLALEVQFVGEEGIGLGPALEFYDLVAEQLSSVERGLWRTVVWDSSGLHSGAVTERRVVSPLFPSVYQSEETLHDFEVLGLFIGRLFMEGRTTNLRLHPLLLRRLLGHSLAPTMDVASRNMVLLDPDFERSLRQVEVMSAAELYACELYFVLPTDEVRPSWMRGGGRNPLRNVVVDIPLTGGGSRVRVTKGNVEIYTMSVRRYYLETAIDLPLQRLREGLQHAFNPVYLTLFSVHELSLLISGPEGKIWPTAAFFEKLVTTSQGYTKQTPVVQFLVDSIPAWSDERQRLFLRFVTGSSALPVGGMHKPFVIVPRCTISSQTNGPSVAATEGQNQPTDGYRQEPLNAGQQKDEHVGVISDDGALPSVSTCFQFLKLPAYSSKAILEERLVYAMTEGQGSFILT